MVERICGTLLGSDVNWYLATAALSALIQNVYILHDILHGATFPPYDWQKYITRCWADQFCLPWKELVLEHWRHHDSTLDLLVHGIEGLSDIKNWFVNKELISPWRMRVSSMATWKRQPLSGGHTADPHPPRASYKSGIAPEAPGRSSSKPFPSSWPRI